MEVIPAVGSVVVERCVADPQVGPDGCRCCAIPGGVNRRRLPFLPPSAVSTGCAPGRYRLLLGRRDLQTWLLLEIDEE